MINDSPSRPMSEACDEGLIFTCATAGILGFGRPLPVRPAFSYSPAGEGKALAVRKFSATMKDFTQGWENNAQQFDRGPGSVGKIQLRRRIGWVAAEVNYFRKQKN